ncbi:hypothetical protein B0T22DRAFT_223785 [Podospora appendiculata]|uniref:Uncharacterized protein n=1 Tax=Podospora appendiculata TaxID=314037 RepID=A0AAE0X5T4_9PEZI|nr:hypothetical protein B0T22DRAFT_223785 [Podospora appendiculata]
MTVSRGQRVRERELRRERGDWGSEHSVDDERYGLLDAETHETLETRRLRSIGLIWWWWWCVVLRWWWGRLVVRRDFIHGSGPPGIHGILTYLEKNLTSTGTRRCRLSPGAHYKDPRPSAKGFQLARPPGSSRRRAHSLGRWDDPRSLSNVEQVDFGGCLSARLIPDLEPTLVSITSASRMPDPDLDLPWVRVVYYVPEVDCPQLMVHVQEGRDKRRARTMADGRSCPGAASTHLRCRAVASEQPSALSPG